MYEGKRLGNHVALKLNQGIWLVYLFKNEEKAKKERRMTGRQEEGRKEEGKEEGRRLRGSTLAKLLRH